MALPERARCYAGLGRLSRSFQDVDLDIVPCGVAASTYIRSAVREPHHHPLHGGMRSRKAGPIYRAASCPVHSRSHARPGFGSSGKFRP